MTQTEIDRFFAKVEKTDTCWIWNGATNANGSGSFRREGGRRTASAVHLAWRWAGKAELGRNRLKHSCANTACVNPDHLFAETAENNLQRRSRLMPNGCIEWTGNKTKRGYGMLRVKGRGDLMAHRYSYELEKGPIPDGLCVLHRCDNPSCINADHLFLGTKGENNADRHAKGRTARGQPIARFKLGVDNPQARLTPDIVREIRARVAGGEKHADIADAYGVTQSHVSRIGSRDAWKHLP